MQAQSLFPKTNISRPPLDDVQKMLQEQVAGLQLYSLEQSGPIINFPIPRTVPRDTNDSLGRFQMLAFRFLERMQTSAQGVTTNLGNFTTQIGHLKDSFGGLMENDAFEPGFKASYRSYLAASKQFGASIFTEGLIENYLHLIPLNEAARSWIETNEEVMVETKVLQSYNRAWKLIADAYDVVQSIHRSYSKIQSIVEILRQFRKSVKIPPPPVPQQHQFNDAFSTTALVVFIFILIVAIN